MEGCCEGDVWSVALALMMMIVVRNSDGKAEDLTVFVQHGALSEQVLAVAVDAVAMEVVRLEETRPEVLFAQSIRDVLGVLPLHCSGENRVRMYNTKDIQIQCFSGWIELYFQDNSDAVYCISPKSGDQCAFKYVFRRFQRRIWFIFFTNLMYYI